MKKLVCGLILFSGLSSGACAASFLNFGGTSEVFLTAKTAVSYDDNIFLNDRDELADTIFTFTPGFDFVFGQGALTNGRLIYGESITRYADNSHLNKSLSSVSLVANYDDTKVKGTFNGSFQQLNQNTIDVRGPFPVRRDVSGLGGTAEVSISDKSSVAAGASFDGIDYKRKGYADSKEYDLPLNYFYHFTPKVDLSLGFRYRDTTLQALTGNSSDYYYSVGARGEFSPKLIGQFDIGLNQRRVSGGGTESSVGAQSSFTYLYSEKTSVRFGIGNDFGTSAEGDSQKNFLVTTSVTSHVTVQWDATAALTYRKIKYFGNRTDDFIDGQLATSYTVNEHVTILASYDYRRNNSNLSFLQSPGVIRTADFWDNVFSISAEFRY